VIRTLYHYMIVPWQPLLSTPRFYRPKVSKWEAQ
jgi:hypothetical protein